eukprot:CAMPEP_0198681254 /NCGR_PEP_ID=MMETSP1468-20131203/6462_1 /TAXON_ID=1461545 /ORGANISM="Mantoniella sp, Strain CCMP1436" /LENGTH=49 /DNA_ID= /DNA_START= /DNA_END= /DNA_ORIENTATION=
MSVAVTTKFSITAAATAPSTLPAKGCEVNFAAGGDCLPVVYPRTSIAAA